MRIAFFFDEIEKKDKETYEASRVLKKFKVVELEKSLSKFTQKEKYINVYFNPPEMGKDIIVSFSVQDDRDQREEYDSKQELKKLIQSKLAKTNWRLMSDGITYRMGILQGRLRGYDGEEELIKLIKKDKR